ncbi:hypothetical protein BDU57DRAFT_513113 [Ampelomyces quisqualis]|uniref:Uncharacterized protein n=1 Tax=Ampelomyces quisqualis TaxID=50730 RepID=A0A6A5QYB0_AMPQU|nr:hypothetical protein BDU57DRAFT_513113 [Ampelomyces quisqualis]
MSTPISAMGPLGPMTTPFLPPESCGTVFYNGYYERDMSCNPAGTPVRDSSCFLSSSSTYPLDFIVTYSPAIACPIGWTSNKGITNPSGTQIVVCCPSGYPIAGTASCLRTSTMRGELFSCIGGNAVPVATPTITTPQFIGSASSIYTPTYTHYALQVQLVIPPSAAFTTFTAPLPVDPNAKTSSPASSSTPSAPAAPVEPRKKKISGGAIAGIVIGALALIALIIACLFIHRRKRKSIVTSQHHNNIDNGLPEFVPYGDHQAEAKVPPVSTSVVGTPTLVNSSPHQTDRNTVFSERSHLSMAPHSPHQPEFIPSRQSHVPPAYFNDMHSTSGAASPAPTSNVARLEADKAALEERIARMRYLAQMEEEQANMQAELERMRAGKQA